MIISHLSPELVFELIDKEPLWFERQMLIRMTLDPTFASQVTGLLFAGHDGNAARSFQLPMHVGLAKTILMYHAHRAPVSPLALDFAQTCLTQVANSGALDVSNLNNVWNDFMHILQEGYNAWPLVVSHTNLGCSYWLKQIRQHSIYAKSKQGKWRSEELQKALYSENAFIDKTLQRSQSLSMGLWEAYANPLPDVIRVKTSINGLNTRLNGGFGRGEATMFIAASGVGKSTVATQFASEWAIQGCKTVYVSTEPTQPAQKLMLRMFAQHCRIPYAQIVNGINYNTLTVHQQEAMRHLSRVLGDHNIRFIHWFNRPDIGNVGVLRDAILKEAEVMGGLDAIVFDWIGGAIPEEIKNDATKVRLGFKSTGDMIANLVADLNSIGLATVQGHEKRAKNNARVAAADVTECLNLHQCFTAVIGMSGIENKDEGGNEEEGNFIRDQFLNISKARNSLGGLVSVTRMFEYQRLVDRRIAR